jgi:3-phosphoshikimate 1-carboxyvinyltransferase
MGELIRLKADPGKLKGRVSIQLPGSKSFHNRLLIIQNLSCGKVKIKGESTSEDTKFLRLALDSAFNEMWLGEGGTALRFGLAWAAITPGDRVLDGSKRLRERPILQLVEALRELGADIRSVNDDNRLPLLVKGKRLKGGRVSVKDNISSQFISALLMIGPYTENGISITLPTDQVSMPYIRMTIELMKRAGARVNQFDSEVLVQPGEYQESTIEVERDWSSASYFFEWALFNPELQIDLPGLTPDSLQGDAAIVDLFLKLGVSAIDEGEGLSIRKTSGQEVNEFDFLEIPDMAQSFAVAAAGMKKKIKLTGLQTLKVKETDRIAALKSELLKVGVACSITDNTLEIAGFKDAPPNALIETFRDHRMAMAFAPLVSKLGEIQIKDRGVVGKSFPDYWEQVAKLGVQIIKT